MERIKLKDKEFELFIPFEELHEAIRRMAMKIKADVEGRNPLFIGILNGAFMFISELMQLLDGPYELVFARYSTYAGTSSTGELQEIMPVMANVDSRMIILLEDIIDSGFTMHKLKNKLIVDGAAEVRIATMLFKPEALKHNVKPDYIGMEIPNDFIVGHGLDYDGHGRSFRDIYKLANS
jgi:hypoxanthine phosphoribosyltransferase